MANREGSAATRGANYRGAARHSLGSGLGRGSATSYGHSSPGVIPSSGPYHHSRPPPGVIPSHATPTSSNTGPNQAVSMQQILDEVRHVLEEQRKVRDALKRIGQDVGRIEEEYELLSRRMILSIECI